MKVYDYSPNNENKSGKPDRIALSAHTQAQYNRVKSFLEYYFGASFPNGAECDFTTAKKYLPKNSKIMLSCCWNSITGKYEITYTNKTIIRKCWNYWKYDFIGNMTDFAFTI